MIKGGCRTELTFNFFGYTLFISAGIALYVVTGVENRSIGVAGCQAIPNLSPIVQRFFHMGVLT
jgi:hypothetical protein